MFETQLPTNCIISVSTTLFCISYIIVTQTALLTLEQIYVYGKLCNGVYFYEILV
jgi:hypothetical protein